MASVTGPVSHPATVTNRAVSSRPRPQTPRAGGRGGGPRPSSDTARLARGPAWPPACTKRGSVSWGRWHPAQTPRVWISSFCPAIVCSFATSYFSHWFCFLVSVIKFLSQQNNLLSMSPKFPVRLSFLGFTPVFSRTLPLKTSIPVHLGSLISETF